MPCAAGSECVDNYCQPIKQPDPYGCADNPSDPACIDDDGGPGSEGDGWPTYADNCPDDFNPDQLDTDGDGLGDACDGDPEKIKDTDGDGVSDSIDNCCNVANPDQEDLDEDGSGDVCPIPTCFDSNDPACVNESTSCIDYDKPSNPFYAGIVFINEGKPSEQTQSDFCVDDGTAVMEVGCAANCGGEGYHFQYIKKGCGVGKSCQNGYCK